MTSWHPPVYCDACGRADMNDSTVEVRGLQPTEANIKQATAVIAMQVGEVPPPDCVEIAGRLCPACRRALRVKHVQTDVEDWYSLPLTGEREPDA